MCMFRSYVYTSEKVNVLKSSRVHMGHERPKINNATETITLVGTYW